MLWKDYSTQNVDSDKILPKVIYICMVWNLIVSMYNKPAVFTRLSLWCGKKIKQLCILSVTHYSFLFETSGLTMNNLQFSSQDFPMEAPGIDLILITSDLSYIVWLESDIPKYSKGSTYN